MKKTILFAVAVVAISFASCKKDRTCACSYTTVDAGTETNGSTTTSYSKTELTDTYDVTYAKVSKKYGREACPATDVYVDNYDYTNGGANNGKKGARTTTTTCELK